jgi:class 3 adenylate cyclase/tetratricopeptide (TPR) repeat protein
VAQICPNCGEENPDRFRICGMCGAPLAAAPPAEEVRKTVTIVFSDLKGSTSLGERLDTESLREVLNVYFREMQTVLERHGGTVEKFIGDAIMAVFGLPTLHEDDAVRAVRAAFEMKETLARVNDKLDAGWGVRLENRTGVNTGEVVAGDVTTGQRLVTGDTVNTAARLEQAAPALEILIGEPTYRLVKDAVEVEPVEPLELKGKAERVPAYKLLRVTSEEGVARRLDAPMVGREKELQLLVDALDRAVGGQGPQLVTVFAPAGTGKSRLLREFITKSAGRAVALRGRCLSYGDGITFWPLGEVVRAAAEISDDDPLDQARSKLSLLIGDGAKDVAERIGAAIGLSEAVFPVQETFWAARRFLEIVAARKALIVDIEDIHWAEQTFLDLLKFVVDSGSDARVVIVCTSRPDLLDSHPSWGEETPRICTIRLEPLSSDESSMVMENLLGGALEERIRTRVVEAAEGNPLFVEQMLSMLIDDGALERNDRGEWILLTDPGAITIPPGISALITARLDRLAPPERSLVERGSVMGQVFFRGGLEHLVADAVKAHIDQYLQTLTKKELIRPHDLVLAGQASFRFAHVMIRDSAYQGLLKRTRAELHEKFVDWLEAAAPERVMEYEEIRGYHLEQAYLIRSELGPLEELGVALGIRGSQYLSSAGRRALARGDMPATANLFQRAAAILPPEHRERILLLIHAGEALTETGEFDKAEGAFSAALEQSVAQGDLGCGLFSQMEVLWLNYSRGTTEGGHGAIIQEVERAIPIFDQVGDHAGLALAWRLLANVHFAAARFGLAEAATRQLIEHAKLAGDELMATRVLPGLALCALYGPTPVEEGIRVCEDVLQKTLGDRKAQAQAGCTLAHLEAMQGHFDRARELYPRSRAAFEELGWRFDAALVSVDSGPVEMLAGDLSQAEAELRRDLDSLQAMGDASVLPSTAAYLADVHHRQGRSAEAEELTEVSERLAADDDIVSQVLWRSVRAKVLAGRGRFDEAETLGRQAVELIAQTEDVVTHSNTLMDLGEVLRMTGKMGEAASVLNEALAICERKGDVVSAARARALAEQTDQGPPVVTLDAPAVTP